MTGDTRPVRDQVAYETHLHGTWKPTACCAAQERVTAALALADGWERRSETAHSASGDYRLALAIAATELRRALTEVPKTPAPSTTPKDGT